ncbi:MAG: hypothetical protein AB7E49_00100 [Campylobacterales bacterium]
MDEVVLGFSGVFVGAAVSIVTTWIMAKNNRSLQASDFANQKTERQREFQRKTLLELQDVANELDRSVGLTFRADHQFYKENKEWGKGLIPEGLSEKDRLNRVRFLTLVERVSDDKLRTRLKEFNKLLLNIQRAKTYDEALAHLKEATQESGATREYMGEVLRSQY